MRTTLNIADDVLEAAKNQAHMRNISVGEALSELARRGLDRQFEVRTSSVTGLPVIHHPGAPVLTSEEVYRLLAKEDLDEAPELTGKP